MKKILSFSVVCFILLGVSLYSAKAVETMGAGFTAPQVKGTSNVYNPMTGDIVYDYNTTLFYGYDSTGAWQALGSGAVLPTPAGVISAFAGSTASTGYLLCN